MMNRFNDNFYQRLKILVFPIMLQTFMLSLVSATDAVMLGLLDQSALSASSLGGQVQFIFNLFINGISSGTAILVSQYWGKRNIGAIERIFRIALCAALPLSAAFTFAAAAFPEIIMRIYTGERALIENGVIYLRTVSLSYLLCGISQIYLTMLKNTGRAVVCSRISSFAVILNIILNAFLIFGLWGAPKLGIAGAAIATVISRAAELLLSIAASRGSSQVQIRWSRLFQKDPELKADFNFYTSPIVLALVVWGIAYAQYSVIMGHMGSDAVAAYSVVNIAKSIFSCLINGLAGGASIIMGNTLGCGDLELSWNYSRRFFQLSIAVGVLTGCMLMALSPLIVSVAPLTAEASGILKYMIILCGINIMFNSFNRTVLNGILFSGGDSRFDMYGNIGAMWCFSVPLGYIGAFLLHVSPIAVYLIISLDEIVKIPAVVHRYNRKLWMKNITRE